MDWGTLLQLLLQQLLPPLLGSGVVGLWPTVPGQLPDGWAAGAHQAGAAAVVACPLLGLKKNDGS